MKSKLLIYTLFFFVANLVLTTLAAQSPCREYEIIREKLTTALDSNNVQEALEAITALRACDPRPASRNYIDSQYERIIDVSEEIAREAEAAKNDALAAQKRAETLRRNAERAQANAIRAENDADKARDEAQEGRREALVNNYMTLARQLADEATSADDESFHLAVKLTEFVNNYLDSSHYLVEKMLLNLYHKEKLIDLDPYKDNYEDYGLYDYEERYKTISAVAHSPDGKFVAIGGNQNKVLILDAETEQLIQELYLPKIEAGCSLLSWSDDGAFLAVGSERYVYVWSTSGWFVSDIRSFNNGVLSFDWSSKTKPNIAVGLTNGAVHIIDTDKAETIHVIDTLSDYIRGVKWSPNNEQLMLFGDDSKALLFDIEKDATIRSSSISRPDWIIAGDWHPSRKQVLLGDDSGNLIAWDIERNNISWEEKYIESSIADLKFNKGGSHFAFLAGDTLYVKNSLKNNLTHRYSFSQFTPQKIDWSADQQEIWITGYDDDFIVKYNLLDSTTTEFFPFELLEEKEDTEPFPAVFKGDENNIITAVDWKNEVILATGDEKGSIRLFNFSSRSSVELFAHHQNRISNLKWGEEGLLAVAGGNSVDVWNTNETAMLKTITLTGEATAISWSPEGEFLAIGSSDGEIFIWQASNWELLFSFQAHQSAIYALDWGLRSSNYYLLSGGIDREVAVWNLAERENSEILLVHEDWIRDAIWLPGDSLFVTAGDDYQTIVWRLDEETDVATIKFTIKDQFSYHYSVAASDNGQQLMIGFDSGVAVVWDISGDEPQKYGYVVKPGVGFYDLAWRPGQNAVASTAPGGAPLLTQIDYRLEAKTQEWLVEGKALEEEEEEENDEILLLPKNAYHDISRNRFCWTGKADQYVVVDDDGQLIIYNHIGDEAPDTLVTDQTNILQLLPTDAEGSFISVTSEGKAFLGDAVNKEYKLLAYQRNMPFNTFVVSPDKDWGIGVQEDNVVRLWNLTEDKTRHYTCDELRSILDYESIIKMEFYIKDESKHLIILTNQNLYDWEWEAEADKGNNTGAFQKINTTDNKVLDFKFINDTIVFVSNNGEKRYWDIETKSLSAKQPPLTSYLNQATISPSGRYVAGFEDIKNPNVQLKVWELKTGQLIYAFGKTLSHFPVSSVIWSEDETRLSVVTHPGGPTSSYISENDYITWVWDIVGEQKNLISYNAVGVYNNFSPSQQYLQTASDANDYSDARIDFWPISKNDILSNLKKEVDGFEWNTQNIKWFGLEPGLLYDPEKNIPLLQHIETEKNIFTWADYFLNKANQAAFTNKKERNYQLALLLLKETSSFSYDASSSLYYLNGRVSKLYGDFLSRQNRSADSVSLYLRQAMAYGAITDMSLVIKLAVSDWEIGQRKQAMEAIVKVLPNLENVQFQATNLFMEKSLVTYNTLDIYNLLRVIYQDNIPAALRVKFSIPAFDVQKNQSIDRLLSRNGILNTNDYLTDYYLNNAYNLTFDNKARILFAQKGMLLLEKDLTAVEENNYKILQLYLRLAQEYSNQENYQDAYNTLEKGINVALAQDTILQNSAPEELPYFRKYTLKTIYSDLAFYQLLIDGNLSKAQAWINQALEVDQNSSPANLNIRQGHLAILNNQHQIALQFYVQSGMDSEDARQQVYQELIALDLRDNLRQVADGLKGGN